MLDRRAASFASAVLVLAFAGGCDEPPSYQLRWRLGDAAALADPKLAAPLTSVKQCAEVGMARIRVTTRRADDGRVVDRRSYPCFPSAFERGEAVEVRSLPDGEYVIEVERVRRTGKPWMCEEGQQCSTFVGDRGNRVTVREGSVPELEVVLLQPPQCDDGIDNDGDGRVDGKDPACIFDPTGLESDETKFTLLQLETSFLDSPAVLPANVSVAGIRLGLDTDVDGDPSDDQPLVEVAPSQLDTGKWPFRLPLLSYDFEDGDYVLSAYAVDKSGNQLTTPHELEFSVPLDAFVYGQLAFSTDKFLAPIIEPFAATVGLQLAPTDVSGSTCELGGYAGVAIEQMRFRVTDQDDQPLDAATLSLLGSAGPGVSIMPVDEADGWISFACPSSAVVSDPLSWGSYALEVEARIGAATCFTSDGLLPLAPRGTAGAQSFLLARVVDDQGAPPPGCEECFKESHCPGQTCDQGICKDIKP